MAVGQGLPVLEDVAPVAAVAVDGAAGGIAGLDREPVPGTARVAVPTAEAHRQVFPSQPQEMRIAATGCRGHEVGEADVAEAVEPRQVPRMHGEAPPLHEPGEVAGRARVAGGERAPAHDVEERVGEMVRRDDAVGRALQAVGRRHPPAQEAHVGGEAVGDRGADRVRARDPLPQGHDGRMVEECVGDDEPFDRLPRRQHVRVVHEIAAEVAAHLRTGFRGALTAKLGDAPRRDQPHRPAVAARPGHRGPERLGRLRAVADRGVERGHHQPLVAEEFMPHVGRRQVAVPLVRQLPHAGRQELVPAVEAPHLHRLAADVLDRAPPHDPERLARGQPPPDPQPERLVGLLEDDARAALVLVQMPRTARGERRLPPRLPHRAVHAEQADDAAGLRQREQLVDRLVGKDGPVGIAAARRQRGIAAHEHPERRRCPRRSSGTATCGPRPGWSRTAGRR